MGTPWAHIGMLEGGFRVQIVFTLDSDLRTLQTSRSLVLSGYLSFGDRGLGEGIWDLGQSICSIRFGGSICKNWVPLAFLAKVTRRFLIRSQLWGFGFQAGA